MNAQTDQTTIQAILAGDVQAYTLLVNTYKDGAVMLAYNILLNQQDAEEAAQDAFVRVYTSLHTFKAASRFSTWLYRVVLNTALNKKKIKKRVSAQLSSVPPGELPNDFNNALTTQVTAEQRKHIKQAMNALNERERLCITLYYLNELSVEEIHELTAISRSNIKVLLHRGRKKLYGSFHIYLKEEITSLI